MKRIITICAAILMTASVFAQAPEKMSYQAVVRDGSNNLVNSTSVGMRIQILQGSQFGAAVYVETQTPTSNANGLVSLEIGTGTVVSGDFTTIDWANGPYFIKTETDPTGGTSYSISGTSQLMSVPYALYSKEAGSAANDLDTDPTNEYNTSVVLNGTNLETTDLGGTITTDLSSLVDDADADTTNEYNTGVVLNGTNLETTDLGGTITTDLSSLVDDADADPNNEIQTLSYDENTNTLSLSNGGDSVIIPGRIAFYAHSGGGTLASGAQILFQYEAFDYGNGYNPSNSSYVAPATGVYSFNVGLAFGASAGQTMIVMLRVNGTQRRASRDIVSFSGSNQREEFNFTVFLIAGQTVQLFFSGNTLSTYGNANPAADVITTFEGFKVN